MRDAFVLRLTPDTDPAERRIAGWIEEVDTGREIHFRSLEELLAFLEKCLNDRRTRDGRPETDA